MEEHALVQSLADTQWRLESIPGLKSALYDRARRRGEPLLQHPDPIAQRLLLDAQTEVAEAKALKNLRLHERRLRRHYEQDKTKLNELRNARLKQEEHEQEAERERQQAEAEQQRRREQAQKRAERRKAKEVAITPTHPERVSEPAITPHGFEFSTASQSGKPILTLPDGQQ